jgi:hypothetical protein
MRTLVHPPGIDNNANFTQAMLIGNTQDLVGTYAANILDSYERYERDAPELANFDGVPMSEYAKKRMLQMFRRTNGGSLLRLREMLKRDCRRCPFCNISTASDIDHFLSKDQYPCLAIFSRNLIPICSECNRLKTGGPEGSFIHAYYDEFPGNPFLRAEIDFEPGLVIVNYLLELEHVPERLARRIQVHWKTLGLANRYSLEAQQKISAFRLSLPEVLESGGPEAVRMELQLRRLEASLYGTNHWESALLSALISSTTYCEGRFGG